MSDIDDTIKALESEIAVIQRGQEARSQQMSDAAMRTGSQGPDMSQPKQYGLMSMQGPGSAAGVPSGYRDMSQMGLMQRSPGQRPQVPGMPEIAGPGPQAPNLQGLMGMMGPPQQPEAPDKPIGMPEMNKYLDGLMGLGG